jgi:hypothetical protein
MRTLDTPKLEIDTNQVFIELMWTKALQEFTDFANHYVFKSFQLRLIEGSEPLQNDDD